MLVLGSGACAIFLPNLASLEACENFQISDSWIPGAIRRLGEIRSQKHARSRQPDKQATLLRPHSLSSRRSLITPSHSLAGTQLNSKERPHIRLFPRVRQTSSAAPRVLSHDHALQHSWQQTIETIASCSRKFTFERITVIVCDQLSNVIVPLHPPTLRDSHATRHEPSTRPTSSTPTTYLGPIKLAVQLYGVSRTTYHCEREQGSITTFEASANLTSPVKQQYFNIFD